MAQKGFGSIIVLSIVVILLVISGFWYYEIHKEDKHQSSIVQNATTIQTPSNTLASTSAYASRSAPSISLWGQYDINAPDALMLVDSQGRRTGENPITGVFYREIPNTGYSIGAAASGHPVGELTFSGLPSGQYTLYVLGGVTGPYGVGIGNNYGQQSFQGNIQAGAMIAYVQNYNPANLASSTFSASSTTSSTASITTAPPNNWTPPPVQ